MVQLGEESVGHNNESSSTEQPMTSSANNNLNQTNPANLNTNGSIEQLGQHDPAGVNTQDKRDNLSSGYHRPESRHRHYNDSSMGHWPRQDSRYQDTHRDRHRDRDGYVHGGHQHSSREDSRYDRTHVAGRQTRPSPPPTPSRRYPTTTHGRDTSQDRDRNDRDSLQLRRPYKTDGRESRPPHHPHRSAENRGFMYSSSNRPVVNMSPRQAVRSGHASPDVYKRSLDGSTMQLNNNDNIPAIDGAENKTIQEANVASYSEGQARPPSSPPNAGDGRLYRRSPRTLPPDGGRYNANGGVKRNNSTDRALYNGSNENLQNYENSSDRSCHDLGEPTSGRRRADATDDRRYHRRRDHRDGGDRRLDRHTRRDPVGEERITAGLPPRPDSASSHRTSASRVHGTSHSTTTAVHGTSCCITAVHFTLLCTTVVHSTSCCTTAVHYTLCLTTSVQGT